MYIKNNTQYVVYGFKRTTLGMQATAFYVIFDSCDAIAEAKRLKRSFLEDDAELQEFYIVGNAADIRLDYMRVSKHPTMESVLEFHDLISRRGMPIVDREVYGKRCARRITENADAC